MRIGFTPNQLKRLRHLSAEEIIGLLQIIRKGGVVPVSDYLVDRLHGVGLMKKKAGRAWVVMEINGKKVAPFVGTKAPKVYTDHQRVATMFLRKARSLVKLQPLSIKEWKFATTLAKQYDIAELEIMIDTYLARTHALKISFADFYYQKIRLHRELSLERMVSDEGEPREGISFGDLCKKNRKAASGGSSDDVS